MHGSRRKRRVYTKHIKIESLKSLVKLAKQRTMERVDSDISSQSVKLPLLEMTNRLMMNLQVMHQQLQTLLMEKLDPDARNVIAAEIARESREMDVIPQISQSPISQDLNDLELLNEYRKQYADILGELLVAKDRLVKLEEGLKEREGKKKKVKSGKSSSSELSSDSEGQV